MSATPSGDVASRPAPAGVVRIVTDPVHYGRPPEQPLDPDRWPPKLMAEVTHPMDRVPAPVLLSTADVVAIFEVPTRTIKRWATEDGWTRHGPDHRRRWDLEDVQTSYDRRRRART